MTTKRREWSRLLCFTYGVFTKWLHWTGRAAGGGVIDVWSDPALPVDRVLQWWRGADASLQPVQTSRYAVVQRDGNFHYKRCLLRGPGDRLKHLFWPSRARRALGNGRALELAGFHPPGAMALVEERSAWGVRASGLVTRTIENAPSARDWLNRPECGLVNNVAEKRLFLREFGRVVGRFHAAGFHHADLRIGNVLARREGAGWTWFWLDNEGNSRHRHLPRQLRVHNLMQVNMERTGVTLADRIRFWHAYLEACPLPEREQPLVVRAVLGYTRRRWMERGWLAGPLKKE